jgi:hypothetical protein
MGYKKIASPILFFYSFFFAPAKKNQKSRAEIDVQHDFGPRLD